MRHFLRSGLPREQRVPKAKLFSRDTCSRLHFQSSRGAKHCEGFLASLGRVLIVDDSESVDFRGELHLLAGTASRPGWKTAQAAAGFLGCSTGQGTARRFGAILFVWEAAPTHTPATHIPRRSPANFLVENCKACLFYHDMRVLATKEASTDTPTLPDNAFQERV